MPIPEPARTAEAACDDLRDHGVAVLRDLVDGAGLAALRDRLERVAGDERRAGTALLEDGAVADGRYRPGPNQRVMSLLGKGEEFVRLAAHPLLVQVARRTFGASYGHPDRVVEEHGLDRVQLSSMTANIANPGGSTMQVHADQGFVPASTPYPILLNAVVPLVDFARENGATTVAPGSHLEDPTRLSIDPPSTQPVEAPAGSAILIDGRTWHGTGANRTSSPRPALLLTYCPPWVRPFSAHAIELAPDVLAAATDEVVELLGFEPWFVHGRSEARHLRELRTRRAADGR